jgi:hypothetical protein
MQKILNKLSSFFFPVSASATLDAINFSDKFISLSINKNLSANTSMNRVVQLEDSQANKSQYILLNENNVIKFKYVKNDRLISHSQNIDHTLNQNYINKISELFHFSIDKGKELLNKDSKATSDLSSETKGLEWLRVSLVVLKSAVNKSLEDPTLSFEGQFFCGHRQASESYQMRIQCLSLDFLLEFLEDGRLSVLVWNYKDSTPNSKAEPTFSGEFVKIKQAVFDEFIQLLVLMSKGTTKTS